MNTSTKFLLILGTVLLFTAFASAQRYGQPCAQPGNTCEFGTYKCNETTLRCVCAHANTYGTNCQPNPSTFFPLPIFSPPNPGRGQTPKIIFTVRNYGPEDIITYSLFSNFSYNGTTPSSLTYQLPNASMFMWDDNLGFTIMFNGTRPQGVQEIVNYTITGAKIPCDAQPGTFTLSTWGHTINRGAESLIADRQATTRIRTDLFEDCLDCTIPGICDDNDACTVDGCGYYSGCTHTPVQCGTGKKCSLGNCVCNNNGYGSTCDTVPARLSVTSSAPSNLVRGSFSSVTYTIKNSGVLNADVVLRTTFPFTEFQSCTSTTSSVSCSFQGQNVIVTFNQVVAPNATVSVSISGQVPCDAVPGNQYILTGFVDATVSNVYVKSSNTTSNISASSEYVQDCFVTYCGTPGFCDDNDACTNNICNANGCSFEPVSCGAGKYCSNGDCLCNNGGVAPACIPPINCSNPSYCDDHDACTVDQCDNTSGCSYYQLTCSGNNQHCNAGTCVCNANTYGPNCDSSPFHLSLAISSQTASAARGAYVSYTFTTSNSGPLDASYVTISSSWPFVNSSCSSSSSAVSCSFNAGTMTITSSSTFVAGSSVSVTVTGAVDCTTPAGTSSVSGQASSSYNGNYIYSSNAAASTSVQTASVGNCANPDCSNSIKIVQQQQGSWESNGKKYSQWSVTVGTTTNPLYSVTLSIVPNPTSEALTQYWGISQTGQNAYTVSDWRLQSGQPIPAATQVQFGYIVSSQYSADIIVSAASCTAPPRNCSLTHTQIKRSEYNTSDSYNQVVDLSFTNYGNWRTDSVKFTLTLPAGAYPSQYWNLQTSSSQADILANRYVNFTCSLWGLYPGSTQSSCGYILTTPFPQVQPGYSDLAIFSGKKEICS